MAGSKGPAFGVFAVDMRPGEGYASGLEACMDKTDQKPTASGPSDEAMEVAARTCCASEHAVLETDPSYECLSCLGIALAIDAAVAEAVSANTLAWRRTCDQVLTGLLYQASRGDISAGDVREALEQIGTLEPGACCAEAVRRERADLLPLLREALAPLADDAVSFSTHRALVARLRAAIAARAAHEEGR